MIKPKKKLTCYFCGEPATSREHAPPKCFFPEKKDIPNALDFRKNLITVPSCALHNSEKNRMDALFFYRIASLMGISETMHPFVRPKLYRAIALGDPLFEKVFTRPDVIEPFNEAVVPLGGLLFKAKADDLIDSVEHLTRALFFKIFGFRFSGECRMWASFIQFTGQPDSLVSNQAQNEMTKYWDPIFDSYPQLGANPAVFQSQFIKIDQMQLILRAKFFEGPKYLYILSRLI